MLPLAIFFLLVSSSYLAVMVHNAKAAYGLANISQFSSLLGPFHIMPRKFLLCLMKYKGKKSMYCSVVLSVSTADLITLQRLKALATVYICRQ